jgi:spore germination protein GerM
MLEVFTRSFRGAPEENLVSIPLKLKEGFEELTVQVYFRNSAYAQKQTCDEVFPIERTVTKTTAGARAALLELLEGPSEANLEEGFRSAIPADVVMERFVIQDGAAKIHFSRPLPDDACLQLAIRAQIDETLAAFDSIESVEMSFGP